MNNKNLFEISTEEKNRILNLHEVATKKLYILKETKDVKFSFPSLNEGGYKMSTANLGMVGLYSDSKGFYFTWGNEPDMFQVPEMNELNANPNWIITRRNNTTPYEDWINGLNSAFLNDDGPIFYIPTYDKNTMEAVWLGFEIYSKTKRSKKGLGGLVGLGKRFEQYYVEIVKTIRTYYKIPTNK